METAFTAGVLGVLGVKAAFAAVEARLALDFGVLGGADSFFGVAIGGSTEVRANWFWFGLWE